MVYQKCAETIDKSPPTTMPNTSASLNMTASTGDDEGRLDRSTTLESSSEGFENTCPTVVGLPVVVGSLQGLPLQLLLLKGATGVCDPNQAVCIQR